MPKLITKPTKIDAAGNSPKRIEEFIGRVNSDTAEVSIAKMKSPPGWMEPSQTPQFNEYTFVLKGEVQVQHNNKKYIIGKNEVFIAFSGEKIQYSTPKGAEYIAVCLPAFSAETVNRD